MNVNSYGIHWDGNVAWLIQGRGSTNFVGVKGKPPFTARNGMCNHFIQASTAPTPDRSHWERFQPLLQDPLVQAMLPIPHANPNNYFIDDRDDSLGIYLINLARLSSPIESVVRPAWTVRPRFLEKESDRTNVQPLVITQLSTKDQDLVSIAATMALYTPRTIIMTGAPEMVVRPPMQRITTSIQETDISALTQLPLEALGAFIVRRYARKEQLDGPIPPKSS